MSPGGEDSRPHLSYRPELDGIRGLAIALVVFVHFYVPGTEAFGWVGVNVFFALSGYLITTILLEEYRDTGRLSLRNFYLRRVRRLAPALIVLVVVVASIEVAVIGTNGLTDAGWALSYLANWRVGSGELLGGLSHTWSLSIEEQFYLVWPFLLWGLLRAGGTRLAFAAAVAIGTASLLWRLEVWSVTGDLLRAYYGSDTRADALMAGAALAVIRPRWVTPQLVGTLAVVAILIVCLTPVGGNEQLMLGAGLATSAFATLALITASGGLLASRPAVEFGKLSYSLYLWHYPVMFGAHELWGSVPIWAFVVAVALAWMSYRFIERPFRVHHN